MHNTNKKLEVLFITLGVFFKCLIPLGQCIQVLTTPPVVLKGYDVVAYHLNAAEGNDIATLGNETYSYNLTSSDSYGIDRIYTFYFVNENNLQLFMNDAWKYVPQFGGFSAFDICFDSDHNDDIWNGIHMGPASGPDNEFHGFGIYNNTLYLNINENMYKTFEENAANCIKLAQTQWIEWFGSLNAGIFNHDCFDDGNACMATPQALAPAVNSSQDRFLTLISTTEIGNDNNKKSDDYYVGKLTKKEFFVLLIGIAMIFALIIGICIIISQYRKYIKMYDETHDMNSGNDTSNTKDTKIGTKSTKKVKVSNESRRSFIPLASSEEANNPDVIIENMKQIGFGDLSSALEDVGNNNDNDNDNDNDEKKNNNDNNSDDNNNNDNDDSDDNVDPIKDYDDDSDDNEQNENEIENNNNGVINTTATIATNVESFRLPPPS